MLTRFKNILNLGLLFRLAGADNRYVVHKQVLN
jgi:hypothetical protein